MHLGAGLVQFLQYLDDHAVESHAKTTGWVEPGVPKVGDRPLTAWCAKASLASQVRWGGQ